MGTREDPGAATPSPRLALAALMLLGLLAGCGSNDFGNDPRPPVPVEVSASVTANQVIVSPHKVGGGLATFTVSNQSETPVRFTLVGPAPQDNLATNEIPPGGVGNLKAELQQGDYEASAGDQSQAKPATLTVGPQRKSSQNDLLLP